MSVLARHRERMRLTARAWAEANPSDPFAFNRAMSHMLNGVGSDDKTYAVGFNVEAVDCGQSMAEPGNRLIAHRRVPVNMQRP